MADSRLARPRRHRRTRTRTVSNAARHGAGGTGLGSVSAVVSESRGERAAAGPTHPSTGSVAEQLDRLRAVTNCPDAFAAVVVRLRGLLAERISIWTGEQSDRGLAPGLGTPGTVPDAVGSTCTRV
jgi:hypothetical protein